MGKGPGEARAFNRRVAGLMLPVHAASQSKVQGEKKRARKRGPGKPQITVKKTNRTPWAVGVSSVLAGRADCQYRAGQVAVPRISASGGNVVRGLSGQSLNPRLNMDLRTGSTRTLVGVIGEGGINADT
jgi:hypothetical protein